MGKWNVTELTPRQLEIALLVATGISNKEIARRLGISISTVKKILTVVFSKTEVCFRTELAVMIVKETK
jgi:DNA-binding NarL/FixJ family response regulator